MNLIENRIIWFLEYMRHVDSRKSLDDNRGAYILEDRINKKAIVYPEEYAIAKMRYEKCH